MATARLPLHGASGRVRGYAQVDEPDAARLGIHRWHILSRTSKYRLVHYVARFERRGGKRYTVYLHREVLGLSLPWETRDGLEPDHINSDGLDNRRSNLRVVTHAENMQNRRRNAVASSRFRGVFWNRHCSKWGAKAVIGGRSHYLGLFANEADAANAVAAFRAAHMPFSADASRQADLEAADAALAVA